MSNTDPTIDATHAAGIQSLQAELDAGPDPARAAAIEASLRSLRNNGVRTDLEAQAREGIIDHADLPADILAAPVVSPPGYMPTSQAATQEVPEDVSPMKPGDGPATPDATDVSTPDVDTAPSGLQAGPPAVNQAKGSEAAGPDSSDNK